MRQKLRMNFLRRDRQSFQNFALSSSSICLRIHRNALLPSCYQHISRKSADNSKARSDDALIRIRDSRQSQPQRTYWMSTREGLVSHCCQSMYSSPVPQSCYNGVIHLCTAHTRMLVRIQGLPKCLKSANEPPEGSKT